MYREALLDIIAQYKENFDVHRPQEIYKWEAAKWFYDNWDEDDNDFPAMLGRALGKKPTDMLDSRGSFPRNMICRLAEREPETVKTMFISLGDETKSITEKIADFSEQAEYLRKKYNPGSWNNHYQTPTSVCTYLFFMNPGKNYIYKYQKFRNFASKVHFLKLPKKGDAESVIDYYEMCDEVLEIVKKDEELISMSKKSLQSDIFYDDDFFHLLADDIVFFGARSDIAVNVWWPSEAEYTPGINEQEWQKLLKNPSVFGEQSLTVMKRFLDYGGEATCKQLSEKYGETPQYYNGISRGIAQRVFNETQCRKPDEDSENSKWWPILFVGKYTNKEESGIYKWKLRAELQAALEKSDLREKDVENVESKSAPGSTESESAVVSEENEKYTKQDFINDVYMDTDRYESLKSLLKNKLNVILQGPPGVGKTYAAKRLAYSIIGSKDDSHVMVIQFHQNYSYEDFVMGYKPKENGFELKNGVFYEFCMLAKENPDEKFFFIIDEINRGNLSKIFGELLMMIEKDYRGESVVLAYRKEKFSVPENIYIIGMMNTADRSLAMIDYALRRRFAFFEMQPAFEEEGFIKYRDMLNHDPFSDLVKKLIELNTIISKDASLGEGFCIGHSYFCGMEECSEERLTEIVEYDLIPLLKEYWFDNKKNADEWAKELRATATLNDYE